MSYKVVKKKTYAGFGYDCCKFIDVKTCGIEEQLIVGKFFHGLNQADAQEQFLRIKNAYQTLVDSNSRAKYDASQRSRTAADWDPFQWSPSRPKGNSTVQEEDFYGFEDFLRDLESDMSKRQGSRSKQGKMKSLWEELADIGEEFVEFLEKELNIDEGDDDKKQGADFAKQQRQSPKGAYDSSRASRQDAPDDKRKEETETAEIEDMLAKLKKELGI
jgi:DnaJ-class molecular chaperone